jgi:GNAT superfamily N-acetyltransferase
VAVVIRDASPGDAAAVAALLDELGYPAPEKDVRRRLERLPIDRATRVLVAQVGGEVAGLIATHVVPRLEDDRPSCRVIAIVTAQRHRRAGVGSALMARAEGEARARGAFRLDLSSGEWRDDAHAFYERMGFRRRAAAFVKHLE